MSDRFLDRVLQFMGIQDEEDDDEQAASEEEETDQSAYHLSGESGRSAETGRRGRLVSLPARESGSSRERFTESGSAAAPVHNTAAFRWRMAVLEPESFDDVQAICDHLKERRPVVVSVERVDKELSKRIIDFVSGTTYAIDGNIQRVGESIFVFTPNGVQIDADIRSQWED